MKRAVAQPAYRNTQPFMPPDGVMEATVDPETGQLATRAMPQNPKRIFHRGQRAHAVLPDAWRRPDRRNRGPLAGYRICLEKATRRLRQRRAMLLPMRQRRANPRNPNTTGKPAESASQQEEQPEKKKGVLGKIFGIFGGGNKKPDDSKQPQQ